MREAGARCGAGGDRGAHFSEDLSPRAFRGEVRFRWVTARSHSVSLALLLACRRAGLTGPQGGQEGLPGFLPQLPGEDRGERQLGGAPVPPCPWPGEPPCTSQPPPCAGRPGPERPRGSLALPPPPPPSAHQGHLGCYPSTAVFSPSLPPLPEQVLRVPVPSTVAFELGKEKRGDCRMKEGSLAGTRPPGRPREEGRTPMLLGQ